MSEYLPFVFFCTMCVGVAWAISWGIAQDSKNDTEQMRICLDHGGAWVIPEHSAQHSCFMEKKEQK